MHHIIYASRASHPMTQIELADLLEQAHLANERQHITGVLVYGDEQFMQVMEGERAVVEALYARITQDTRHRNVFKLADKSIDHRSFGEWSMAFERLSPAEFTQLAGYLMPAQLVDQLPVTGVADTVFMNMLRELVRMPAV